MTEARKAPRSALALALEIDDGRRGGRLAVTRNVSAAGLCVNTPSRFVPGSRVELRLHDASGRVTTMRAEVARVEDCDPRSDEPWRYHVGLRLARGLFDFGARRKAAALLRLAEAS